ncbi:MAG: TolC family protein [Gemmatimonadetes bacterium]|nr:TolC family protein [Gemmatimonadota bacterium]
MRSSGMRALLALVLCSPFLLPTPLLGQGEVRRLSLREAMQSFAENSLELKIARSEAAGLTGAALQSRAYSNPAISFSRDDLGHESEKFWEETFLLVQQVEWPGRTAARGRVATHTIGAGAARLLADSIELAFVVREAYAQAWFEEQAEQVVRQTASVIRGVAEDAETRLEAGDISAYEARRLRLERVQAEQAMAEAALRARDARRRLATLIAPGAGTEEIGPSEGMDGVPPIVTRETALGALPGRPDLQAVARELDAARAGEQVARSSWIPDPTVGLGYRHHLDGFAGASIALDLPFPLFDRGTGTRQEAAAQSSGAAYRLDLRRRLARYDLMAASDRYDSGRARLEAAAPELLVDGEALLASATAAYAENEMTLLELLDAAGAFQNARLSAMSLRLEAWVAYYDLLRAMGGTPEEVP